MNTDKANASQSQEMGFLHSDQRDMTIEEAQALRYWQSSTLGDRLIFEPEMYVVYYDYELEKFVAVLKKEYELFATRKRIGLCKYCAVREAERLNGSPNLPFVKIKEKMEILDNVLTESDELKINCQQGHKGFDPYSLDPLKLDESKIEELPQSKQSHMTEFLRLKCSGDVLNVVGNLGHDPQKEISESMGMLKRIKGLFLAHPMKYNLVDLCAGNALTSVLAVHLLPVDYAIAVDKMDRKRRWDRAIRFHYHAENIFDKAIMKHINSNTIIIGVHACNKLARRMIEIYKNSQAKALFIMPCCLGQLTRRYPQQIDKKLGSYMLWCWDLAQDLENASMTIDKKILSPKNIIIGAIRENE